MFYQNLGKCLVVSWLLYAFLPSETTAGESYDDVKEDQGTKTDPDVQLDILPPTNKIIMIDPCNPEQGWIRLTTKSMQLGQKCIFRL